MDLLDLNFKVKVKEQLSTTLRQQGDFDKGMRCPQLVNTASEKAIRNAEINDNRNIFNRRR
jgi:hypothetical protein